MASDGLIEIPDGSYQLVMTGKYHLVVSNGKAFLAPSGPTKPISDLLPDVPSPTPQPPAPAAPSKVMLFLKEHKQQLIIGVLSVLVVVLALLHFHPSGPWVPPQPTPTPTPPGPPPRPPWIPPGPPEPPAPTPNPRLRQSQAEDQPSAEPGPEPTYRKKAR